MRGDGQHHTAACLETRSHLLQHAGLVADVLENIKGGDDVVRLGAAQVGEMPIGDGQPGALTRCLGRGCTHLEPFNATATCRRTLEHTKHVAAPAPNFEDAKAVGETLDRITDQSADDQIARAEPEVSVFDREQALDTGRVIGGPMGFVSRRTLDRIGRVHFWRRGHPGQSRRVARRAVPARQVGGRGPGELRASDAS